MSVVCRRSSAEPPCPTENSHETALRLIETLRQLPRYPKVITSRQLREQLAARGFVVDIRTIQRNLNDLSCYYSICNNEQKPQGWCWMPNADTTDLPRMDPATALAFRLASLHLAPLLPATLLARFDPYLKAADRASGRQRSHLSLGRQGAVERHGQRHPALALVAAGLRGRRGGAGAGGVAPGNG